MTCSTCGRENPAHLTFCQECGQRLGPRIAPPTPPIGIQDAYGPPPAPAPFGGGVRMDPRAATSLGMPQRPVEAPPPAPAPAPGLQAAAGERRCKICDTANPANLRYCTSCGSTLEAAPAPAPAVVPARAPEPPPVLSPAPPPVVHASPIVPAVQVASAAPAEATRTCGRCNGLVEAGAMFCKFCGNPLGETPIAPAVMPAPPLRANGAAANLQAAQPSPRPFVAPPPAPVITAAPAPSAVPSPPVAAPSPAAAPPPAPRPVPTPAASPLGPAATIPAPPNYGAAPEIVQQASAPAAAPASVRVPVPVAAPTTTRGRLVVIAKSGADGPSYPFADLLDIGRTEGNVVISEDPYLSPRHARLLWENGKLLLRDLGSTNGVYLRLAARGRGSDPAEVAVPLVDGDHILVGQQVFRFEVLRESGYGPAQEHGTLLFGSPASPRYARLCQRTVEGITRDVYYVRKVETVLGRESGDVVFTEDPFLSRRHAAIRVLSREAASVAGARAFSGNVAFDLVDLGSSNGTFLRIRNDAEVTPGDHFRVGQQLFRVDFDGGRG